MGKSWGKGWRFRKPFRRLILASAVLVAGCDRTDQSIIPAAGVIELSDQFTGGYDLIDQNGARVTQDRFKGKVAAVYFGFATCPDVCPMALGLLSAALNELPSDAQGEIVPIFITIDPERDTPEALKAYLGFNERLVGLTGSVEDINAARQAFKVYARKQPLERTQGDYTMDHTSYFYLVDRQGRPRVALQDTMNAQEIAEALRRAIKWR